MSATAIALAAFGIMIVRNWAFGRPGTGLSPKVVVEIVIAVLFIAVFDHGQAEPLARGFAWLLLAVAVLGSKGHPGLFSATKQAVSSKANSKPISGKA